MCLIYIYIIYSAMRARLYASIDDIILKTVPNSCIPPANINSLITSS